MTEVGVYEAKTQLPKLLNQVARGRRITITKHGIPVAVLVPATPAQGRPVKEVIRGLLAFRKGRRLGKMSLRAMIAEGRR
jgi:prevent-host-death family protein